MSELLKMPKVDNSVLENKDRYVSDLRRIIVKDNVLSDKDEIRPYETDALTAYRQMPVAVVLPENVKEVSEVLKYCNKNRIKVVPRGAGTGLSGGSLPLKDCVLMSMSKFNKILDVDYVNRCVKAQPCVTNLSITFMPFKKKDSLCSGSVKPNGLFDRGNVA